MNYELWLILIDITSFQKIKLINKYKTAENVYNNFEEILKENETISKKLKNFQKDDLYYEVLKLEETLYKKI
ncbi:hypothetical protein DFH46_004702 [Clostridium beijerinckii]|nr:hypothetical protein [Clostridium beijerinckii]NRT26871.1 hypothetical protein [Clostridium beijerinckii]NRU72800.1 hypothetical protein [Clostridium beijerinckii]NRV17151.1 hypothetical protein [Clostridium beijerinckii]NRX36058.1 hypothetical protein [Clostridium beijerinckii]NRX43725.1 hypothetical protein [Clostridium beijerinckii]